MGHRARFFTTCTVVTLSLAIAPVSYVSGSGLVEQVPNYTSPALIFQTINDAFSWSASVPLFARAEGPSKSAT